MRKVLFRCISWEFGCADQMQYHWSFCTAGRGAFLSFYWHSRSSVTDHKLRNFMLNAATTLCRRYVTYGTLFLNVGKLKKSIQQRPVVAISRGDALRSHKSCDHHRHYNTTSDHHKITKSYPKMEWVAINLEFCGQTAYTTKIRPCRHVEANTSNIALQSKESCCNNCEQLR